MLLVHFCKWEDARISVFVIFRYACGLSRCLYPKHSMPHPVTRVHHWWQQQWAAIKPLWEGMMSDTLCFCFNPQSTEGCVSHTNGREWNGQWKCNLVYPPKGNCALHQSLKLFIPSLQKAP